MPTLTPDQIRARPIVEQIARALAPIAWREVDEHCLDDAAAAPLVNDSLDLARQIQPCLEQLGLFFETPKNLGESIAQAQCALNTSHEALKPFVSQARGDLDKVFHDIRDLNESLQDIFDDIVCIECADFNNDGEGFDGRCGSCADRLEDA